MAKAIVDKDSVIDRGSIGEFGKDKCCTWLASADTPFLGGDVCRSGGNPEGTSQQSQLGCILLMLWMARICLTQTI